MCLVMESLINVFYDTKTNVVVNLPFDNNNDLSSNIICSISVADDINCFKDILKAVTTLVNSISMF